MLNLRQGQMIYMNSLGIPVETAIRTTSGQLSGQPQDSHPDNLRIAIRTTSWQSWA